MKKYKFIMSITFILLLLILGILSFSNKQIYSFLGIDKVKDDTSISSYNINTNSNTESSSKNNKDLDTLNNNSINIYKAIIPEYKLGSMNQDVEIGFKNTATNSLKFVVKKALKTKYCPNYTLENDVMKSFSSDVMNAQGELIKDYYYLDVDISVTNAGKNTTSYAINSLEYITITSDKHEALWRNSFYSEGATCKPAPYYWEETDGKSLIPIMEFIMNFAPGETCEYRACYIVPEEYNSDEIYLCYSYGKKSIEDEGQKFIKLDIQEVK